MSRRPIVYCTLDASDQGHELGVARLEKAAEDAICDGRVHRHHRLGPKAWTIELRPGIVAIATRGPSALGTRRRGAWWIEMVERTQWRPRDV